MSTALKSLGLNLTQRAMSIFSKADSDGDGMLGFAEFRQLVHKQRAPGDTIPRPAMRAGDSSAL